MCIIINSVNNVDDIVKRLKNMFESQGNGPSTELVKSWEGSLRAISLLDEKYPIILELPIFTSERADFVVVGKNKALIIEAKGWKNIEKINDFTVKVEGIEFDDPCYQLNNYLSKLKLFHSASKSFDFDGTLYLYKKCEYSDNCEIVKDQVELMEKINALGIPADENEVKMITEGKFTITEDLIELVKNNKEDLLQNASRTLLSKGYGLSSEQLKVVREVLNKLESGEVATFLVNGESGSGKTLVALTILFEAISRGKTALIGYKNNRLLNTLRKILKIKGNNISSLVQFYSTGQRGQFKGLCEKNFPIERYGEIDLILFDEAQRMTEEVIKNSVGRARITVYFYDESQILIGDEAGNRENFLKYLNSPIELRLSSPYRAPKTYVDTIMRIFDNIPPDITGYDFKIFDDIKDLIDALKMKKNDGNKVALICSFTESDGDIENPQSIKNLRIGYPLQSGFELYKGKNLEIRWLMNERTEYPRYWIENKESLERCSSVYGAQGFEAQYIGVIWGRDYLWRNYKWEVNTDPYVITDNIGAGYSLKSLAKTNKNKAEKLLKNRYYIMLTRGIKGTYIFFEDEETRNYIKELIY